MICRKVRFLNEIVADAYIKKLAETSVRQKIPKRAYLCPNCMAWHLTSKENKDSDLIASLINKNRKLIARNKELNRINQELNYEVNKTYVR